VSNSGYKNGCESIPTWLYASMFILDESGNSAREKEKPNSARPLEVVQTKQLELYYIAKLKYMAQNKETLEYF
jgi:hypothetical protein